MRNLAGAVLIVVVFAGCGGGDDENGDNADPVSQRSGDASQALSVRDEKPTAEENRVRDALRDALRDPTIAEAHFAREVGGREYYVGITSKEAVCIIERDSTVAGCVAPVSGVERQPPFFTAPADDGKSMDLAGVVPDSIARVDAAGSSDEVINNVLVFHDIPVVRTIELVSEDGTTHKLDLGDQTPPPASEVECVPPNSPACP